MADKVAVIAWLRKYAGAYTIPGVDNNELANWLAATPAPAEPSDAAKDLAMMLRRCASALQAAGREEIAAAAMGLLDRLGLGSSPLRERQAATPAPALIGRLQAHGATHHTGDDERITCTPEQAALAILDVTGIDVEWAATPAPAPGWQPIETAPKDFFTEFDGWNGERVPDVSWAHPEYAAKDEYDWCISVYEAGFGWVNERVKGLTHWMPLPQPPKEQP